MGRCNVAAFEDEGHDAWEVGGLQRLETTRKLILPSRVQKGT